jgi:L-ribulose-5-phosphate 3-epimerase
MITSRRDFIKATTLATAGIYSSLSSVEARGYEAVLPRQVVPDKRISVFSKCLQWLDYENAGRIAAEIGFDAIDLTVRPKGHVLPERVKEDLPKAVAAIRKAGIAVHMITTAINQADDPYTEDILKTAHDLGIQYYRLNWFPYDHKLSIVDNLGFFKKRMDKLAALNRKYAIHGAYQNHAGANLGSSVWDLYEVIKDADPEYLGCQYDVRHAMVEGAYSWVNGLKLIQKHVKSHIIKDFQWNKKVEWQAETVPIGEGMVDFNTYFLLIKEYQIQGPVCMHFEYPLGGAELGGKSITISRDQVIESLRNDLNKLKFWLRV